MAKPADTRLLQAILALLGVYALAMIVLGEPVNQLFEVLGFGAESAKVPEGEPRRYVLLLQGVLGSVIVGWVLLMLAVVRHGLAPNPNGPWWAAVAASIGVWFVLDTGFSLVVGSWQHALFNLAFLVAIAVPMAQLRPTR